MSAVAGKIFEKTIPTRFYKLQESLTSYNINIPGAFLSHSSDLTLWSPLGILHCPVSTLLSLLSNEVGAPCTVRTHVCFPHMLFHSRDWVLGSGHEDLDSEVARNSCSGDGSH